MVEVVGEWRVVKSTFRGWNIVFFDDEDCAVCWFQVERYAQVKTCCFPFQGRRPLNMPTLTELGEISRYLWAQIKRTSVERQTGLGTASSIIRRAFCEDLAEILNKRTQGVTDGKSPG